MVNAHTALQHHFFESLSANGRPLGNAAFLASAEAKLGRNLRKRKPGPKRIGE